MLPLTPEVHADSAIAGNRTPDARYFKPALYLLSYDCRYLPMCVADTQSALTITMRNWLARLSTEISTMLPPAGLMRSQVYFGFFRAFKHQPGTRTVEKSCNLTRLIHIPRLGIEPSLVACKATVLDQYTSRALTLCS